MSYNPNYKDEEDEEEPIYDFRPSKWEYERRKELEARSRCLKKPD